jgi:hypothetical protein
MLRNTAGQTWTVFAFNEDGPVDGDAANITAVLRRDGVEAPLDATNPTPLAGRSGFYDFALALAETDFYEARLFPVSSTPGVEVYAVPQLQFTAQAASFNVLPLLAATRQRKEQGIVPLFVGETGEVTINVSSPSGTPVDLTGKTLTLSIETQQRIPVANLAIVATGSSFSFNPPSQVTESERQLRWSLWDAIEDSVLCHGIIDVTYVPQLPN